VDAYVYAQTQPGTTGEVLAAMATKHGVRRAVAVIGEWDVLVHAEGPDLATIALGILSEIHNIPGVVRTATAPVVPPDRIGITGFGGPKPPPIVPSACYVHIKAEPGAAAGIAERLGELPDVAGVAVLGGTWDIMTCIAQPWEVGSGVILEQVHQIPGIVATSTLVSVAYEEPEEDRDQFSAWS
jgi:DNA-binding Lrp family transcriptional regulator